MLDKQDWEKIIYDLAGQQIPYIPALAKIGGGVKAGLFLSQAVLWTGGSNNGGWFSKTVKQWTETTGLTAGEQETARRRLRERNFLEEKKQGIPCQTFYRANIGNIIRGMK